MGNANQTGNRDQSQPIQAIKGWPLLFHQTHSTNVQLSPDHRRAKRLETFCNGICFSNRPVSIGEQVILRFSEVSTSWSGVLRFGFTSHDPTSINAAGLPRYACPDLTNKYGYWAKALPERFALQGNILCFHVCRNGNVMYSVNGEDKGLFFGGIVTGQPLWALIDIYGNSTAIEFIDPRLILSLPLKDDHCTPTLISASDFFFDSRQQQPVRPQGGQRSRPSADDGSLEREGSRVRQEYRTNNRNLHQYNRLQHRSLLEGGVRNAGQSSSLPDMTSVPARHHKNLSPLPFHSLAGKNVCLSQDRSVATRVPDEYCNGYVFTSRPLRPGEKIVVQILALDEIFSGGIAFGMTSCDVSLLDAHDLPDDADLLLDRPEYWVVNKDVCSNPSVGDELSFHFTNEGEIKYGKNGFHWSTLMHVDKEVKLWAFFDVYGQTQKIKVLGVSSSSSFQSSGTLRHQHAQVLQQQVNLIDGSSAGNFGPMSDLIKQHHGNFQQELPVSPDEAPPRPPPPAKKSVMRIPALPPKQVKSASSGISNIPESMVRKSPSSAVRSLSPPRLVPIDALSISSVESSESQLFLQFSCHPSIPPNLSNMTSQMQSMDQDHQKFQMSPKSAPDVQRPPLVAPKPSISRSANVTHPNLKLENVLQPMTFVDFPSSTLTYAQSKATQGSTPPTPVPRNLQSEVNISKSEPVSRKYALKSTTASSTTAAGLTTFDIEVSVEDLPVPLIAAVPDDLASTSSSETRENNECSICWEKAPDCALYTCGHMCMCYDCALALKESRDAHCPICRQPIKDIIKIYRS